MSNYVIVNGELRAVPNDVNSLQHWKYIKRERKNGKWRYTYPDDYEGNNETNSVSDVKTSNKLTSITIPAQKLHRHGNKGKNDDIIGWKKIQANNLVEGKKLKDKMAEITEAKFKETQPVRYYVEKGKEWLTNLLKKTESPKKNKKKLTNEIKEAKKITFSNLTDAQKESLKKKLR